MRSSLGDMNAAQIIRLLDLRPHPEGGWYGETFRAEAVDDARPCSTAIYYLLEADQVSAWHRVDADEAWHFYAGAPLVLTLSPPDGVGAKSLHLGSDLMAGQRPQAVVPKGWWQAAESLGAFSLVGCTVAPGFDFAGFELAPPDWRPKV
jgi:predicted cupin superfamily sugar epimerase